MTKVTARGWVVRRLSLGVVLLLSAAFAHAAEQIITPSPATFSQQVSTSFAMDVIYSTANPEDATLTGIGFRLCFDDTKLTFTGYTNEFLTDRTASETIPTDDINDVDGDPATNKCLNNAWASLSGSFPSSLTQRLYTANFSTSPNFSSSTSIRFRQTSTAAGRTFQSTPATINFDLGPDITRPVITLLGANPINLLTGQNFVDPGATAADDRDGDITANIVATGTVDTNTVGTYTRRYNVSDAAGNAAVEATRTINVALAPDTVAPTVTAPDAITVEAASAAGTPRTQDQIAAFLAAASATDARDGSRPVANDAPVTFALGPTTVTFSASDNANNIGTATSTVSVVDTTPPALTPPANLTLEPESANGVAATSPAIVGFLNGASAIDLVDGTVTVTNDFTLAFAPLGVTTVTFSTMDSRNNQTTRTATITVVDEPPTLTPPASITVEALTANGTPASTPAIAAFLAGAVASDPTTPNLLITNNAPTVFPLGATTVTFSVSDARDNTTTATATVTVRDTTPPVVTAPANITTDATGDTTSVQTNADTATAVDTVSGNLTVAVSGASSPFAPGRNVVTYSATDAAGNTGSAQQIVAVNPILNVGQSQSRSEGETVVIDLLLNGDAPTYPVVINFTVSGTANNPSDHDLVSGSVAINSGRTGAISFNIANDPTPEVTKTVVVTLDTVSNAALGVNRVHTVTIVEANVEPIIDTMVSQATRAGFIVVQTDGDTTARVLVSDANVDDVFNFDWSGSASALMSTNGTDQETFVFSPSGVTPGFYDLNVVVTDLAGASVEQTQRIQVVAAAPTLGTGDADGDGTNDTTEGFGDDDGDGVPNFQDPSSDRTRLPVGANGPMLNMATEPGLSLQLGGIAFAANLGGSGLTLENLRSFGGPNGTSTTVNDAAYNYPLPFFDFIVEGVVPGGSARVVLPLPSAIPTGQVDYRKFHDGAFFVLVRDAANDVFSAPATAGACPGPGDAAYVRGLTAGHQCVQLLLEDGGPNDDDDVVDGRIVDPGTVGAFIPPPPPPPQVQSRSGGGGCSLGQGGNDPTLPVLALLSAVYALRRRNS